MQMVVLAHWQLITVPFEDWTQAAFGADFYCFNELFKFALSKQPKNKLEHVG
jgi:hypothetical protein